jgi:hypothetical protein
MKMTVRLRKSSPVSLLAIGPVLAGICFLGAGCSQPGSSCSGQYPDPVTFSSAGKPVSTLTVCANSAGSGTDITNTSDDVVWYVSSPRTSYWTGQQDRNYGVDLATLIFRAAVRATAANPRLTIEPGNNLQISIPPGQIKLRRNPGEQVAWQTARLIADSVTDKSEDALTKEVEEQSGPSGSAVIACVKAAYAIGKSLSSDDDSQDVLSRVSAGLGLYSGAKECSDRIDEARMAEELRHRTPPVTLSEIQAATHDDSEWEETETLFDDALKFLEDGLQAEE